MNASLLRKEFTDRSLEPDDLQTLTRMLADWHLQHPGGDRVTVQIAVNFWGFPKKEGEAYRTRLAAGAAERALETDAAGIVLSEPNVLTLKSAEYLLSRDGAPLQNLPDVTAYLRLLLDPALEGFCAEVRLILGDGGADKTAVVLWGVRERGQFRVRAIWPHGKGSFSDDAYALIAWQYETPLFAALHDYGIGKRAAPEWVRKHLFVSDAGRRVNSGLVWFLQPEKKSVGAYFLRLAVSGGLAAASFSLLAAFSTHRITLPMPLTSFVMPLLTAAFGAGVLGFSFQAGLKLSLIASARNRMRASLKRAYAQPVALIETDLGATTGALQDPALVKLSRDIEDMGGRHFKDVRLEPAVAGHFYIRLYVFPDEATVFSLMLMHRNGATRVFPARPTFLLRTGLTEGWRLASTNGGSGYRKPLRLPVISRVAEGLTDPEEMLEKHRAALQAAQAAGKKPVPVVPDEILADFRRDQEETREALQRYGYFHWDDAARMVFKTPRPENRF